MDVHEALKASARETAAALGLPLAWEGESFVVPAGPYLRGRVEYDGETAASCGEQGLTRLDGALVLAAAVMARAGRDSDPVSGTGDSEAVRLARRVADLYPRGRGIETDRGELVFRVPAVDTPRNDGARVSVSARLAFYGILQREGV